MLEAPSLVAVHGIWNGKAGVGRTPEEAGAALASKWTTALAAGLAEVGLQASLPQIAAPYYSHLLATYAQGGANDLNLLTPQEQAWCWTWMRELGVPAEAEQGHLTLPLRHGLDWLARHRRTAAPALARIMAALLRELFVYISRPAVRNRVRETVGVAIEAHRPRVVVAHSLGSVVTYEALHARSDLAIDLLVTVGSPLGMPEVVFDCLDPEPSGGRGAKPPGVKRWVNIADVGDLVAVPKRLGDRFPVDVHGEASIGSVDNHTMGGYLSCGLTATAIQPYL